VWSAESNPERGNAEQNEGDRPHTSLQFTIVRMQYTNHMHVLGCIPAILAERTDLMIFSNRNMRQVGMPLLAICFTVVALTGLVMAFDWVSRPTLHNLKTVHEWFSYGLLALAALHLFLNIKPFRNYLRPRPASLLWLLALALAGGLFYEAWQHPAPHRGPGDGLGPRLEGRGGMGQGQRGSH
jgi:hypothetical protein